MRKENMHQSVEVTYSKLTCHLNKTLQFNFFQMVYVISGKGLLHVNGNNIGYQTGNLMLMTPSDYHYFDIAEPTEFLLVKINSEYVKEYKFKNINCMECLLYYASHLSGCILRRQTDEFLVKSIADSLLYTIQQESMYNEDLIIHYVNALIVIAVRNISTIKPEGLKTNADNRVLEIINYIQANIFDPQKLKVPTIADQFGISETYLGSYFKNQCGENIQHFIAQYRDRLIKHRLKFSDKRINEIAEEFGFADESHLNKFFKTKNGLSPSKFRKESKLVSP